MEPPRKRRYQAFEQPAMPEGEHFWNEDVARPNGFEKLTPPQRAALLQSGMHNLLYVPGQGTEGQPQHDMSERGQALLRLLEAIKQQDRQKTGYYNF